MLLGYILATIGDDDTWLGLYDYNKNGTYTWVDTTPVDYINGDSSTTPGLCVNYACSRDSCWNWVDCNTQRNYLCEYLENPPPHKATSPRASSKSYENLVYKVYSTSIIESLSNGLDLL